MAAIRKTSIFANHQTLLSHHFSVIDSPEKIKLRTGLTNAWLSVHDSINGKREGGDILSKGNRDLGREILKELLFESKVYSHTEAMRVVIFTMRNRNYFSNTDQELEDENLNIVRTFLKPLLQNWKRQQTNYNEIDFLQDILLENKESKNSPWVVIAMIEQVRRLRAVKGQSPENQYFYNRLLSLAKLKYKTTKTLPIPEQFNGEVYLVPLKHLDSVIKLNEALSSIRHQDSTHTLDLAEKSKKLFTATMAEFGDKNEWRHLPILQWWSEYIKLRYYSILLIEEEAKSAEENCLKIQNGMTSEKMKNYINMLQPDYRPKNSQISQDPKPTGNELREFHILLSEYLRSPPPPEFRGWLKLSEFCNEKKAKRKMLNVILQNTIFNNDSQEKSPMNYKATSLLIEINSYKLERRELFVFRSIKNSHLMMDKIYMNQSQLAFSQISLIIIDLFAKIRWYNTPKFHQDNNNLLDSFNSSDFNLDLQNLISKALYLLNDIIDSKTYDEFKHGKNPTLFFALEKILDNLKTNDLIQNDIKSLISYCGAVIGWPFVKGEISFFKNKCERPLILLPDPKINKEKIFICSEKDDYFLINAVNKSKIEDGHQFFFDPYASPAGESTK